MKNKKSLLMVSILCSSTFLSPIVFAQGTDEDTTQPSIEVSEDTLIEEGVTSNSEGSLESTNDSMSIGSSDSSVEVIEDSSIDEQALTDLGNESNENVTVEPHAEPNEYTAFGDSAFYKYDEATKTLTLKGTIENTNDSSSLYYLTSIIPGISDVQHIAVDGGLILSGKMGGFFSSLKSLESVETAKIDVSNVTSMYVMFDGDYNLTSLDVSNWDTSSVTDMYGMFNSNINLTSLDVSNWDTSCVIRMTNMFSGASNLTSLDVSNWNTSNVTSMAYMFDSASNLTSLDVSNWDTSSVTDMGLMFAFASNLTSLDVSNWDTSSVTDMYGMFSHMNNLTSLDVSNWDTSSVTDMTAMFSDSINLTSLDLNNWNTSGVTKMERMFKGVSKLTSLDVSNWDTSSVINMAYMFRGDYKLTSLDLSNWDTSNVIYMEQMFDLMDALDTLVLGSLFKVNDTVSLYEKTTKPYTGRWLLADNNKVFYSSSSDFMDNYDGTYPGTYYREQETESSSTEPTSSSSSESSSSSTEPTSSSSSESSSSGTESTSSSSSEKLKPTIKVSDKTMYVGDKLTEEDILNWATFENADGLKVGFEVIGDPILVWELDNTLAEAGSHQIKYYIEDADGKIIEEKIITLTIKGNGTTDTTSSTTSSSSNATSNTNTTNSSGTYTKPVGKTTPISSASTTAGLPQTGETNSPMLTVIGTMTLLASGAYVLNLKRKKSN